MTTTHMEESITFGVQTGSDAGKRTRPEGTVVYLWGCDGPQQGPNDENLQPLPSFDLQPVLDVGERTLLEDNVQRRRGRGRPRKRPNNESLRPLSCVLSQTIAKKPRTNTRMVLPNTSNISGSVEERTPPSNARKPQGSYPEATPESSDVRERIPPEATVKCRRGRGRPRKIPNNDSLRPLLCSLWEPITKKARTKTLTTKTVTIDLPKLVEERTPPLYAQKTEELPHWSGTSVAQLPDGGERTPLDGPKAEELPNCIGKEERNDEERAIELNLPPLHPASEEVSEDSSRPWMWDTEIPGPIPPDVFELPWEVGLLSNFWCGIPAL
ncbi:hypothetical protein RHMOL_Rhmol04G0138700 [Rhododendron molle]|uniref:Uncharacterized protein n=1 Tax=Rhododendron molle TaxID=49168 RepID=A0ACC0P1E8_RHOML|nr:hypothetical protein RHMOL_Rhmol04G0138700 [Rhododendron molle]